MNEYLFYNDNDRSKTMKVSAENPQEAMQKALWELGWSVPHSCDDIETKLAEFWLEIAPTGGGSTAYVLAYYVCDGLEFLISDECEAPKSLTQKCVIALRDRDAHEVKSKLFDTVQAFLDWIDDNEPADCFEDKNKVLMVVENWANGLID